MARRKLTTTESIVKKTDELNKLFDKLPWTYNRELITQNINQAVAFLLQEAKALEEALEEEEKQLRRNEMMKNFLEESDKRNEN